MEKFVEGEVVLYQNGNSFELGIVKRVCDNGDCFVWYHTGDTAARTSPCHLHKITNSYAFSITRLSCDSSPKESHTNTLNVFYMQDNCAEWNDDVSFYLETNAPKEVVEELVCVAELLNNGTLEEIQEEYDNKYNEDWDTYGDLGISVYEIIFDLLEDRGYIANRKVFETIEW